MDHLLKKIITSFKISFNKSKINSFKFYSLHYLLVLKLLVSLFRLQTSCPPYLKSKLLLQTCFCTYIKISLTVYYFCFKFYFIHCFLENFYRHISIINDDVLLMLWLGVVRGLELSVSRIVLIFIYVYHEIFRCKLHWIFYYWILLIFLIFFLTLLIMKSLENKNVFINR